MTAPPEIQFARSDTVDIAYQTVGSGELDIVLVVGWAHHLEVLWELPEARHFIERLAGMGRLILFDKRGTGLSDRPPAATSFEDMVPDVVAVMNAAGADTAALVAWSDGAALAAMLAARAPERVHSLVMAELMATATPDDDHPWGPDPEMMEGLASAIELGMWGQGQVLSLIAPSAAEDPRIVDWFRRLERMSATPRMAADLLRRTMSTDLRPLLQSLTMPCLLLHRGDAQLIPSEAMKWFADQLPDGRYVEVPGDQLPGYLGDVDGLMDEIEDFLLGTRTGATSDRRVATVVFTDVVSSTERLAAMGDRSWHGLLETHRSDARRIVGRYGGSELGSAGDGFLFVFASPSSAIQFAQELQSVSARRGLEIRAGIHSGEVVFDNEGVTGLAVHIGSRIADLASGNEVAVSKTVRDLLLGSTFQFRPLGTRELKGVPGSWEIFLLNG